MNNNVFAFGDTFWHQRKGTAMGTPPAPTYTNIFYSIHEINFLHDNNNLIFYKRYIDDVFGVWLPSTSKTVDDMQWERFKDSMNYYGLEWTHSNRSKVANFMDLRISLQGNRIHTTVFKKSLNLYLYIPPHLAHPPGVLNSLIHGGIHRICTLCSKPSTINQLVNKFYN